ncbi:8-amino-7-oxononanoate synthase [Permianibacter sp. IMCC34836]|uniref:8-amino-7-oxononanoate synthase n=1 Tax=Permianibacter fluminis TaxID=2738515 RepID=UPI001554C938|nr:8-amino-7-oxononanoate synthase [Permianibacter fluminis]NQD35397.1 8-amino-7-oxononanoate synthase [Permianibacter fluminis]
MKSFLSSALTERRQNDLLRVRRIIDSPTGVKVRLGARELVNFSSNDYLGHSNHPAVVAATRAALDKYGLGSGASHLITGHSREHEALEEELAAFTGREAALCFSTGFMANLGIITALVGDGDAVFEDKLNHASLLDGGLASGAHFVRYRHKNCDALNDKLSGSLAAHKLVVTDAVFSMDGDLAPLPELVRISAEQNAWLMVDDAHGFGVLGERGAGALEHFGLPAEQVPIYMATLGKALGTFGAFVAGSRDLIEYLIQFSRPYIYTTAMPAAVAAATRASLTLLQSESWRRERLRQHIALFKACARAHELNLMPSDTAIQPLLVGDAGQALALSRALEARGFLVSAIRPPTVPPNTARLRITLSAAHDERDIRELVDVLAELLTKQDM